MIPFDLALTLLSKEKYPEVKICSSSAYWIPLQWLYVKMIEEKGITRLSELPKEERMKYWKMALMSDKKDQWSRICLCQALYVYDQLK